MYSFEKSADEEMIDFIDCVDIKEKLSGIYNLKDEKLEIRLKKVIKDEIKFNTLLLDLDMNAGELFYIMAKTFPNIFNHRLIKFIKLTYLSKNKI